ncbi:hypothetical protein [uncultured Brachyspira sp.]|uniref:hypothetical protein n=1 Tax=uncultured Brachyspira sp. TaxID=221953 RepID=UPI0025F15802|nr:hypothetical protein [uncultured Brachyspira sp.]
MNFEEELLLITAQKVGLNKSGSRTGNGLLTEVEKISSYVADDKVHRKETDMRLDRIENDIKEMKADIKEIKDMVNKGLPQNFLYTAAKKEEVKNKDISSRTDILKNKPMIIALAVGLAEGGYIVFEKIIEFIGK